MNILEELQYRCLYSNCSDLNIINSGKLTVYAGFDATAPSLHVGNLTTLMMLRLFKKHGHNVIALIGGATTKIGDPSGKDSMRKMLTENEIIANKNSIKDCILSIVPEALILDNNDWFADIKYIDLLQDIGSLFSINRMLTMDSVKLRLEREQNLSFLEFNYMVLQSYDFWHLYKNYNCNVQIGGSDQWGNIVSGIDLIHKKDNKSKAFAITAPLITRSDGKKMGKSEDGAIWLSKDMLSDFDYFQYFRNTPDEDVKKMMLIFTDIEVNEIDKICAENTNINNIKIQLAHHATMICRGIDAAENAKKQAETIFVKGEIDKENAIKVKVNTTIIDLLIILDAVPSKSEARKLIANNGVKFDEKTVINPLFIIDQFGYFKLSVGKKKHFTICII